MKKIDKKLAYFSWGGLLFFGLFALFIGKGISYFTSPVNKNHDLVDYY